MVEIVLLGAGGHCESVIECINELQEYKIAGILDPTYQKDEVQLVLGIPIIGNDENIGEQVAKGRQFVITVGQIKTTAIREKLYAMIKAKGGELPVIKARTAYISKSSSIAEGTVILNNALINCNTTIGKCAIINTGAIAEHGCSIGNFSHLSTTAVLNGEVECGNKVFIGSGTVVNQGCKIGDNTIIGSGSLVRKNLAPSIVVAGNPLRKL